MLNNLNSYKTSLGQINLWFPKSIYIADNVLTSELSILENTCRKIIEKYGVKRDNILSVDSTHKTYDKFFEHLEFNNLSQKILEHSKVFLLEIGYDFEYLKNLKIKNMWCNISKKNEFLSPHVHNNSLLSGVFYVKSISVDKIRFFKDTSDMLTLQHMLAKPHNYNLFNFEYCDYDTISNRLLLFLSNFLHGNEKQKSQEKIAISFNLSCE